MDGAEPRPARSGAEVAEELADDAAHRQALRAYAAAKFGIRGDDADDLVQETILQLLRAQAPVHRPKGFILTLFHARCCDHLERRRLRQTADGVSFELDESRRGGRSVGDTADRLVSLRRGLQEISPRCRQLLVAYYVEGLSLKEAAARLDLAHRGVWTLIHRCVGRLRTCLLR